MAREDSIDVFRPVGSRKHIHYIYKAYPPNTLNTYPVITNALSDAK